MSMSSASYDELLGRRYNVKATVQSVCFVGDHFWSSLHDGKVIIRDFRTGLQLAMFEPEGREKGITLVTAMGYDSKNNRVWIGSNDGFLSAHDASTVRTDHSTATYQGLIFRSEHRQMNGGVCCIACGKGVVWSSGMRDGKIIEHKVPEDFKSCKNIEITATLIGHQRPPKGLLSTSDRRLWSTWEDGVRVFKAGNEKCLAKINFEGAGERMLQVGTMLWQGGLDGKIRVFSTYITDNLLQLSPEKIVLVKTLDGTNVDQNHQRNAHIVGLSLGEAGRVITASSGNIVKVWDSKTFTVLKAADLSNVLSGTTNGLGFRFVTASWTDPLEPENKLIVHNHEDAKEDLKKPRIPVLVVTGRKEDLSSTLLLAPSSRTKDLERTDDQPNLRFLKVKMYNASTLDENSEPPSPLPESKCLIQNPWIAEVLAVKSKKPKSLPLQPGKSPLLSRRRDSLSRIPQPAQRSSSLQPTTRGKGTPPVSRNSSPNTRGVRSRRAITTPDVRTAVRRSSPDCTKYSWGEKEHRGSYLPSGSIVPHANPSSSSVMPQIDAENFQILAPWKFISAWRALFKKVEKIVAQLKHVPVEKKITIEQSTICVYAAKDIYSKGKTLELLIPDLQLTDSYHDAVDKSTKYESENKTLRKLLDTLKKDAPAESKDEMNSELFEEITDLKDKLKKALNEQEKSENKCAVMEIENDKLKELARMAEEQEEKVEKKLEDLRKMNEETEGQLLPLKKKLETTNAQMEAISPLIDRVVNKLKRRKPKVSKPANDDKKDDVFSKIKDLDNETNEIKKELDDAKRTIRLLKEDNAQVRSEGGEAQVAALKEELEREKEKFENNLKTYEKGLENVMYKHRKELDEMKRKMEKVERAKERSDGLVDELKKTLIDTQLQADDDIEKLRDELDALQEKADKFEKRANDLEDKASLADRKKGDLERQNRRASAALDHQKSAIKRIENELKDANNKLREAEIKTMKLEQKLRDAVDQAVDSRHTNEKDGASEIAELKKDLQDAENLIRGLQDEEKKAFEKLQESETKLFNSRQDEKAAKEEAAISKQVTEELKTKVITLQGQLDQAFGEIGHRNADLERRATEAEEEVEKAKEMLQKTKEALKEAENKADTTKQALQEAEKRADTAEKELDKLSGDIASETKIQNDVLEDQRNRRKTAEIEAKRLDRELEEAKKALLESKKEKKVLMEQKRTAESNVEALGERLAEASRALNAVDHDGKERSDELAEQLATASIAINDWKDRAEKEAKRADDAESKNENLLRDLEEAKLRADTAEKTIEEYDTNGSPVPGTPVQEVGLGAMPPANHDKSESGLSLLDYMSQEEEQKPTVEDDLKEAKANVERERKRADIAETRASRLKQQLKNMVDRLDVQDLETRAAQAEGKVSALDRNNDGLHQELKNARKRADAAEAALQDGESNEKVVQVEEMMEIAKRNTKIAEEAQRVAERQLEEEVLKAQREQKEIESLRVLLQKAEDNEKKLLNEIQGLLHRERQARTSMEMAEAALVNLEENTNDKIMRLEKDLSEERERVEDFKRQLKVVNDEKMDRERIVLEEKAKSMKTRQENEDFRKRIQELESEAVVGERIQDLERELVEERRKTKKLASESKDCQQIAIEAVNRLAEMEEKAKKDEITNRLKENSTTELQSQVSKAKSDLTSLRKTLGAREADVQSLEEEISELTSIIKRKDTTMKDLDRENQSLKENKKQLHEQLDRLDPERSEVRLRESTATQHEQKQDNFADLELKIETKDAIIGDLLLQNKALRKQVSELEEELLRLQDELRCRTDESSIEKSKYTKLKDKFSNLEEQCRLLHNDLKIAQEQSQYLPEPQRESKGLYSRAQNTDVEKFSKYPLMSDLKYIYREFTRMLDDLSKEPLASTTHKTVEELQKNEYDKYANEVKYRNASIPYAKEINKEASLEEQIAEFERDYDKRHPNEASSPSISRSMSPPMKNRREKESFTEYRTHPIYTRSMSASPVRVTTRIYETLDETPNHSHIRTHTHSHSHSHSHSHVETKYGYAPKGYKSEPRPTRYSRWRKTVSFDDNVRNKSPAAGSYRFPSSFSTHRQSQTVDFPDEYEHATKDSVDGEPRFSRRVTRYASETAPARSSYRTVRKETLIASPQLVDRSSIMPMEDEKWRRDALEAAKAEFKRMEDSNETFASSFDSQYSSDPRTRTVYNEAVNEFQEFSRSLRRGRPSRKLQY